MTKQSMVGSKEQETAMVCFQAMELLNHLGSMEISKLSKVGEFSSNSLLNCHRFFQMHFEPILKLQKALMGKNVCFPSSNL